MNPTGKGGFQDHPELINRSGRKPSDIDIFALMDECITEADHRAAFKALKRRYRRGELKVVEYIQDRRFGKAHTSVDVTSGNKPLKGYGIISPDDWDASDGDPG